MRQSIYQPASVYLRRPEHVDSKVPLTVSMLFCHSYSNLIQAHENASLPIVKTKSYTGNKNRRDGGRAELKQIKTLNTHTHTYARTQTPWHLLPVACPFQRHIKCFQVLMAYLSTASGHVHHASTLLPVSSIIATSQITSCYIVPDISQPVKLKAVPAKVIAS